MEEKEVICVDDDFEDGDIEIFEDRNRKIIHEECKYLYQVKTAKPKESPNKPIKPPIFLEREEKTKRFVMRLNASNDKPRFIENKDESDDCILERVVEKRVPPPILRCVERSGERNDIAEVDELDNEFIDADVFENKGDKTRKKYFKGKRNWSYDFRFTFDDFKRRTDICMRRVFTVDSDKTKVRDDAFHVEVLGDDKFEIGIHSVDCSDFTLPISFNLFNEIEKSFKLQKHKNKFVNKLIKENMSFDAGNQRRALSLILVLNKKGKIIENPHLCLSIVNIKCNLNIEQFNCLLNNNAEGDPKEWSSYDCRQTLNCGKLYGITLPQLKNDIISLHNVFCYHIGKKHKIMLEGNSLVMELGLFLGSYISQYLDKVYGKYALVLRKNNELITRFRSPLRKVFDVLVLKQLICAMEKDSAGVMSEKVAGFNLFQMRQFIEFTTELYLQKN